MMTKRCVICGKEFETLRTCQVYCSKECNAKGQRINDHRRRSGYMTTAVDRLTEVQRLAEAEGLSYGQYQAKKMLENMHQMSTKRRSDIESEGVNEKN